MANTPTTETKTMRAQTKTYWLPTRPYGLIAAVNRRAAATGSPRYAQQAAGADYNGHCVRLVPPNPHKRYWTACYYWAGNRTIGRGDLETCLAAAEREYNRGALGAAALVAVSSEEDAALCEARGWAHWSKEIEETHFRAFTIETDWRFAYLRDAEDAERFGFLHGAMGLLVNSKSEEDYISSCAKMSCALKRRVAYVPRASGR